MDAALLNEISKLVAQSIEQLKATGENENEHTIKLLEEALDKLVDKM